MNTTDRSTESGVAGIRGERDIPNGRPLSLEAFTSRLEGLGFRPGKRNPAAFQHPESPGLRFVIRKKVVRFEEKEPGKGGVWLLNSSYLISRQLSFALWAAENRDLKMAGVQKRRTVVSRLALFFFFGLGSLAIIFFIVFLYGRISIAGNDYRLGWADLILMALFLGGGIAIAALTVRSYIYRRLFERSAVEMIARVTSRRRKVSTDPDGPDYDVSYYLTVGYTSSASETSGQRVYIEAQVSEAIYNLYQTGFPINVRYAGDNPTIAILEGE